MFVSEIASFRGRNMIVDLECTTTLTIPTYLIIAFKLTFIMTLVMQPPQLSPFTLRLVELPGVIHVVSTVTGTVTTPSVVQ